MTPLTRRRNRPPTCRATHSRATVRASRKAMVAPSVAPDKFQMVPQTGPNRAPPARLSLTLAISGKAEIWSVEYDVVHDTGVEGGTIDGGCKAWIVANTLWIGMSAGEDVGQNILEHWEIDGYNNAADDSK